MKKIEKRAKNAIKKAPKGQPVSPYPKLMDSKKGYHIFQDGIKLFGRLCINIWMDCVTCGII